MATMPPGNLIGGNLVTPNNRVPLKFAEIAQDKIKSGGAVISRRNTFMPVVEQISQANGGSGLTFRAATAFKSAPRSVRLIFNNGLDVAVTVAKYAAVTLPNLNSASLSPAVSNEWNIVSTPLTLPAQIDAGGVALSQPSLTYSDWIPVYPQPSTAGDGTYAVSVTAYIDNTNANYSQNSYNISWMSSNTPESGTVWKLRQQSGDQVTTPGTFSDTTVQNRSPIAGIEALCSDGSVTVLLGGDSSSAGAGATNLANTDVLQAIQAVNVSQFGTALSFMNSGIGGQNTTTFITRLLYLIPIIKPDVVIVSPGSPNDGTPSITGMRTQQHYLQQLFDLCRQNGIDVILRGWMPNTSSSWPQGTYTLTPTGTVVGDVYRQQQNIWALQQEGTGRVWFSQGLSMLGNGAQPERYAPAYTTDGQHPNSAGYLAAMPNIRDTLVEVTSKYN